MAAFTLQQQIKEVEREIMLRESVYPRQVATGKMKQDDAELHLAIMQSVLKTLQWLDDNRALVSDAYRASKPKEAVKS